MPLHDWSRVGANVFHGLHYTWGAELIRELNRGGLPDGYVARPEEYLGPYQSDVLTLEVGSRSPPRAPQSSAAAPQPTATIAPPRFGSVRQRRITVFSARDERRVAVIEIVSPGNKDSGPRARWFEAKLVDYLAVGLHVLVIDVLARTPAAPGLAAAVASELGAVGALPAEGRCVTSLERRTAPDDEVRAYHRTLQLGQPLPDVPLFLAPNLHADVPLEATYMEAFSSLPAPDRDLVA